MLSVYFLISIIVLSSLFFIVCLALVNHWGQHDERSGLAVLIGLVMLVIAIVSGVNAYHKLEEIDNIKQNNCNIEQKN